MAVAGDVTELTFDHPDLGSGRVYPKAAEDTTFDLGGFRTADDDANVDLSGAAIDVMNLKRWSFEGTIAWDDNGRGDLDKVISMAEHPKPATWTISRYGGAVYRGKGKPVGDLQGAGNGGTFGLKLSGGGKLEQIAGN